MCVCVCAVESYYFFAGVYNDGYTCEGSGGVIIDTEEECAIAAAELGYTWAGGGSWQNDYIGCFEGGGTVWFNYHESPSFTWNAGVAGNLCVAAGEAPTGHRCMLPSTQTFYL